MRIVIRSTLMPSWAASHAVNGLRSLGGSSGTVRARASTIRAIALASVFALAISGCIHSAGGVASSNIPIQGSYTVLKTVKGTDCAYRLLGILPFTTGNKTRGALADAQSGAKGATALINITVETWTHHWILFTRTCTEVHGTAVVVE